eukprot:5240368-Heterocapsa_arctica.AAC.1
MSTGTADGIDLSNGTSIIATARPTVSSDDGKLEALLLVMIHKVMEKFGIPLIGEKAGIFVTFEANDIVTEMPTTVIE